MILETAKIAVQQGLRDMGHIDKGEVHLKERPEKELKRLCTGEITAMVVFWICYFQFLNLNMGGYLMQSTAYPLFILSFVLVQGAFTGGFYIGDLRPSGPLRSKRVKSIAC